jgi:2-keto-4-pentenoate hydratase
MAENTLARLSPPIPIAKIAEDILLAERRGVALEPLSRRHPTLTPADAYAIQEEYATLRRNEGAKLVGRKIGCTSRAVQELFGIDQPDYGHLFDEMLVEDGGEIARDSLIDPMAEPEIAFLLRSGLRGPGVTIDDVLAATDSVAPCIEVIDSRIADWEIQFVDTVADNGSSARAVIGEPSSPGGLALETIAVDFRRNGETVASAKADAVLGHPAAAVAWLANALAAFGRSLEPAQTVLSGSITTAVRGVAGDAFEASFEELGVVSCRFS